MTELNKNDIDDLFYQLKLPKKDIKPESFEVVAKLDGFFMGNVFI